MLNKNIDASLAAGLRLGVIFDSENSDYLGWVLLKKHKPNEGILRNFSDQKDSALYHEEYQSIQKPYLLMIVELKKSVHESGDYETDQDYRRKDIHRYSSLTEVEAVLHKLGYTLGDLKDSREIDAP